MNGRNCLGFNPGLKPAPHQQISNTTQLKSNILLAETSTVCTCKTQILRGTGVAAAVQGEWSISIPCPVTAAASLVQVRSTGCAGTGTCTRKRAAEYTFNQLLKMCNSNSTSCSSIIHTSIVMHMAHHALFLLLNNNWDTSPTPEQQSPDY
jgi:hypothetical protein